MRKKLLLSLSFLLFSLYFSASFAQTGDVTWEKFKPFTGTLADLSAAVNPAETRMLTSTDAPFDFDDNYGARMRGYIVPAESGSYTFYIASDDNSELWLSSDILPANKSLKCFLTTYSSHNQWTKDPSQKSALVNLEAGQYYYFEALHREGGGGDNLSIGWTTPSNSVITVIGSAFLSNEAIVDSTLTDITEFGFAGLGVPVEGIVNETEKTISITVPFGSDITVLVPVIKKSFGSTVAPASGVANDFTNPVEYTVTSADGDFTSVYTVTVSIAEARSINTVSNVTFQYPVTTIPAVVDDVNNTITVQLYSGLGFVCTMNYSKDYFAQASVTSGSEIDLASLTTLTITAQNGDIKVYDLLVSELPGVTAFTDEFTDDSNLSGWAPRNWNNSGGSSLFQMSYDATEEALLILKNTGTNDYIVFNFPDEINFGIVEPRLRFRVKSETPLTSFQAKFRDYTNPSPDGNFTFATDFNTMAVPADGVYHEAIWDFSTKMKTVNRFRISQLVLGVDRIINTLLPGVRVDDFRVGADAYANKKPIINSVSKPDWKYINDGEQTIDLSGISDGNPERVESLTITATSNNQTVVKDEDISIDYIDGSETATLSYTGSSNGTAVITITITDDRGTVYSDELDTETTTFVAEFRDATPGVNDVATFGMPQFTHVNVGAGHQHYVLISNVDDGDEDVEQEIIFSFVNNSESMITVDSISYTPGNTFAVLYFHDKGMTGSANVTVSCIDEVDELAGGTPYEMSFDIPLGTYSTFGAYYGATQVAQWQSHPYKQDPVFKDNYPITITQANVVDHCKDDFFWGMMWGYIIAPVSGTYKFYSTTEGEGIGQFYLSTNTSREGLPAVDAPTAANGQASPFIVLEAGKAYYFEAFHKEIINDYFLRLEWIYPGITDKVIIQAPYLFSMIDMIKPAIPTNLRINAKGSNLAIIEWDAASDNLSLKGYMVYVDGYAYTAEPIKATSIMIEGLQPESKHDVLVISVDQLKNYSDPSETLSFTTWGVDENPPTVPENLVVSETTTFSISVNWDASTDAETEVFGYNVYLNGSSEPVNTQAIIGTSYKLNGLEMTSDYSIQVSALDAALNESALSSPVVETTNEFTWDDPNEDAHIGKATITFDALALASGFAIEGGYGLNSIFISNKVSHNSFEGAAFINNMTNEQLLTVGKEKSAGVSYFVETADVFHGNKSARLEVGPGDWIRCTSSINMTPDFRYLLRFGAKKGMGYDGTIQLRVYRETGGVVTAYTGSVTPGDNWEQFEIEFPGILDASGQWRIEFLFNKLGVVYLDDIQFHIKDWYDPDSKFAKPGIQILEELKPAAIRWGAIDANYESFGESVGPYQQSGLTLGDFAELSSMYGDYALLTVGVNTATDWIQNKNTFSNFIEYLAGPAGTTWGDVRIAEGYAEPFDEVLNSIIIEMGNEVWGYDAHGANAFSSNYVTYANWARDITTNYIKNSPYYNAEKMFIAFSGRSPDDNYGLHASLFIGDEGEMDMLGISGYLGGNMNYDPAIDPGESQLDYHKNSYANFRAKLIGLNAIFQDMFSRMGRYVPMYMYEGNLTRDEYHGTVGQAVSFADYYAACMENGVAIPDVFALEGGQWRILDNAVNLKKRPLYYMVQYFNSFCKGGVVLKTNYQSVDPIYNDNGYAIDLPSVGVHAYNNGDQYGVALFSRDFENDYKISLDLPDDIGTSSEGEMVIVSGEMFNSMTATVETQAITVTDGMIITVPKHSAVFITFKADNRTYDPMPGLGQFNYKKVSSIDLYTDDGEYVIDEIKGRKKLNYTVLPADAFFAGVELKMVENTANAGLSSSRNLTADGLTNGSVTVRASAKDGSGIYDEVVITITNQAVSVEDFNKLGIVVYPNPASEYLIIDMGEIKEAMVTLRNVHGSVVKKINVVESRTDLKIGDLSQGVYFMEVQTSNGRQVFRFVKQ